MTSPASLLSKEASLRPKPVGFAELCAIAPVTRRRYTVLAAHNRLRAQALALHEMIIAHGLTRIEKPFPNALWLRSDGSAANCPDAQLLVTVGKVRIVGRPEAGLIGRVATHAIALPSLEDERATSGAISLDRAYDEEAILARVSRGLSTEADARALRMRLSPPAGISRLAERCALPEATTARSLANHSNPPGGRPYLDTAQ